MKKFGLLIVFGLLLEGCSVPQPQAAADLNATLSIAAAGTAAYAAQPSANPKTVLEMRQLLLAAQAALVTWTNSPNPGQQTVVNAAIAALIAYEAAAKPT